MLTWEQNNLITENAYIGSAYQSAVAAQFAAVGIQCGADKLVLLENITVNFTKAAPGTVQLIYGFKADASGFFVGGSLINAKSGAAASISKALSRTNAALPTIDTQFGSVKLANIGGNNYSATIMLPKSGLLIPAGHSFVIASQEVNCELSASFTMIEKG